MFTTWRLALAECEMQTRCGNVVHCCCNLNLRHLLFACVARNFKSESVKPALTLWEEHTRRVLGRRVLRKIFQPKRERVKGDQRKTHNEELYDFSPDKMLFR